MGQGCLLIRSRIEQSPYEVRRQARVVHLVFQIFLCLGQRSLLLLHIKSLESESIELLLAKVSLALAFRAAQSAIPSRHLLNFRIRQLSDCRV